MDVNVANESFLGEYMKGSVLDNIAASRQS